MVNLTKEELNVLVDYIDFMAEFDDDPTFREHAITAKKKLKEDFTYKTNDDLPKGYQLIGPGEVVKDGAIAHERSTGWYAAGNSIGHKLNEDGYVSGITKRGYKYANPV